MHGAAGPTAPTRNAVTRALLLRTIPSAGPRGSVGMKGTAQEESREEVFRQHDQQVVGLGGDPQGRPPPEEGRAVLRSLAGLHACAEAAVSRL